MEITRKQFLQSIFGVTAAAATNSILSANEFIEENPGNFIAPKGSTSHGLFVIAFGDIRGSRDFPVRSNNQTSGHPYATDGTCLWFVWPSEKGEARGYIRPIAALPVEDLNLIVHRIRMGAPEPPYYLYWQKGNYFMYKTPGSLVKRASYLLHKENRDDGDVLQAISDFRFAALINLAFLEDRERTMLVQAQIAGLDNEIRRHPENVQYFAQGYKEALTFSRV